MNPSPCPIVDEPQGSYKGLTEEDDCCEKRTQMSLRTDYSNARQSSATEKRLFGTAERKEKCLKRVQQKRQKRKAKIRKRMEKQKREMEVENLTEGKKANRSRKFLGIC